MKKIRLKAFLALSWLLRLRGPVRIVDGVGMADLTLIGRRLRDRLVPNPEFTWEGAL